jgi:hypothetical protein
MTTIRPSGLTLILAACLTTSCSKKSSSPDNSNAGCRLITVSDQFGSASSTIYSLEYDTKGRVSSIQIIGAHSGSKEFAYSGNTVVIRTFNDTTLYGTDTVTLNDGGLTSKDIFTEAAGSGKIIDTYTYTGSECVKIEALVSFNTNPEVELFSWATGNPTSATATEGAFSISNFYTYNDKREQAGGYEMVQETLSGVPYLKTTNMLTVDSSDNAVYHLDYTFDASGKVTLIQRTQAGPGTHTPENYDLQWQCN